jgi:hypothetical protein
MASEKLFDRMVIELQKDGKSVASIALDHDDMKGLEENFGQKRIEIIENMIQTLEDAYKKRLETKK